MWLPPDVSRASIRRPGRTGFNEVGSQLPVMVTRSLVRRSFPSLRSSLQGDGPNCRQWEVWRKSWGSSYVEKILGAGTQSFPLPCGDHPHAVCTGKGRGSGHVFLLRCGSLHWVSVTAYIVSALCGPWILNSGSDSSALFLITHVDKESQKSEED